MSDAEIDELVKCLMDMIDRLLPFRKWHDNEKAIAKATELVQNARRKGKGNYGY